MSKLTQKVIYIEELRKPKSPTENVLRIKWSCGDRGNIASLCVDRHPGDLCHLDLSQPLIHCISSQGGNFLILGATPPDRSVRVGSGQAGWNLPPDPNHRGVSACWGGAIYVAWRAYKNVSDAVSYLKRYFDVKACGANRDYTQNFIDNVATVKSLNLPIKESPGSDLPPSGAKATERECCATTGCSSACPVWHELITNPAYQGPQGFQVPTMTGRKEPLLFHRDHLNGKIVMRVWRGSGTLNFTFNEHDCRAICERFDAGLQQGRSFATGGTAYFNDKSWMNRPLTIITAPFAAPVIRHARQNLSMPV